MSKKVCTWCDNQMAPNNLSKHIRNCFYKKEFNRPKRDIMLLLGNPVPEQRSEATKQLELSFMHLKQFLEESYHKTANVYKKIVVQDQRLPEEKIMEMQVTEYTKKNYLVEWRRFNKWLKKENKEISTDNANTYLANIVCKASTRRTKHLVLQNLLKYLVDPYIVLNKVKMRISYTPKYAMSQRDISRYLTEQKDIDGEDYLIQRLMIIYGLRINTVASIRIKHLEFLKGGNVIHLPDSKVKRRRVEEIDNELVGLFRDHIEDKDIDEDDEEHFIFSVPHGGNDEKKRAHELCVRINKRINESRVLVKNPNYKYSTHMFRKTKAFNIYNQGVNRLKEQAREAIGQSSGSYAIEHYIYDN